MQKQYEEIKKKFDRVIEYSQGISNPQTDKLFADWLEAKRDFIEAMNGQLIWEYPELVSFELGAKEKNLRVDDFINMLTNKWQNEELAEFVEYERDGFFNNQVLKDYNFDGYSVKSGMKLLKAFKYFESDTKALNDIQSAASMIIQEDKIEGTLCLSVHPLDYLSSSENTHNWRSCHALDGEYRSGNLSYMVDHSTIMCYLKSKKEEKLPDFPEDVLWNSKKWRVLFFFSDDWKLLFAGRQYPFTTDTGLNFVREKVFPAVNMGNWSMWMKKKISKLEDGDQYFHFPSPYIPVGDELVTLRSIIINEPNSLMFNDLLSSSCYDPLYAYKVEQIDYGWDTVSRVVARNTDRVKIHVGGEVQCCRCGHHHIELTESFMCNDCELEYGDSDCDTFATCPCCGNRFYFDEGWWVSGAEETVCPDCAQEYVVECENCGELVYKDDCVYDRDNEAYICKWCYDDLKAELNIKIGPEEDF